MQVGYRHVVELQLQVTDDVINITCRTLFVKG